MDLNFLYAQHQLALIRAAGAMGDAGRAKHLAIAGRIGAQIRNCQLTRGATAAFSWNPVTDMLETDRCGLFSSE